jgi:hypothetical protein
MSAGDRHIGPRFQAGKKYLLGGEMLNRMWEAIATNRILPGPGYDLQTNPGTGTRLKVKTGESGPRPWDIVDDPDGAGSHRLFAAKILWKRDDVASSVTITGNSFNPELEHYLLAGITDLVAPAVALEIDDEWEGDPAAYQFDEDHIFVKARLPIYYFHETEVEGATPITVDVGGTPTTAWAEKLVPDGVLRLFFPLYLVSAGPALRNVPDLI